MDLVSSYEGVNIVSRVWDLPNDYPSPNSPTAYVKLYWRVRAPGEPVTAWNEGPTVSPTAVGRIHFNPDADKNVEVAPMPYSALGTPGFSSIEDAFNATLIVQRETDAPVIGQNSPSTADTVEIGITGFTRFARFRRATISANADMSAPLAVLSFDSANYAAHELPRYLTLSRQIGVLTTEGGSELETEGGSTVTVEDDAATLPLTIYITVAHSGGSAWTPESNVLEVTFAGADGAGGSDGDFDPIPRDKESLGLI
jgi:hypothetical protein